MRTRPLSLIAAGVTVAAVDFRIVAVDVFPDVVGWLLVAAGAWKLARRVPFGLAVLAALASAADAVTPHHYEAIDPLTGGVVPSPAPGTAYDERLVFDRLHDLRLVLAMVAMAAGGGAVWAILGLLRKRAAAKGDEPSARRLAVLWWGIPVLWVAPYIVVAVAQGLGDDGFDGVWNGGYELLALVGLAVVAGLVWMFATTSNRGWATTDDAGPNPWAEMIVKGP
ncbi:MAG: hypothetical protein ACRDZU_11595 [Acidimicrobiales bacterium]